MYRNDFVGGEENSARLRSVTSVIWKSINLYGFQKSIIQEKNSLHKLLPRCFQLSLPLSVISLTNM